jgi:hypothetical protein
MEAQFLSAEVPVRRPWLGELLAILRGSRGLRLFLAVGLRKGGPGVAVVMSSLRLTDARARMNARVAQACPLLASPGALRPQQ